MAHYVYPAATHSRLEHSLGVLESADRMIRSLSKNAEHRRRFGNDADDAVPEPSELDKVSTRLAALLHDVGHGPYSHATEHLIRERFAVEFDQAEQVLRKVFKGVTRIATSETIASLIIVTPGLQAVFEHPKFEAISEPTKLAPAITGEY